MTTVADQGRRAYLNTGSFVWVVDTATGKVITTIERGGFPDEVVLTPDGTQALVVGIGAVLAVDTATNAVTTVRIPMAPVAIAVAPDGSEAAVTDLYDNAVQLIDTATDRITGSIVLPTSNPSAAPELGSLTFSPDGHSLYVADDGNIAVVETADGRVTHTITVAPGGGLIGQLAVSPDGSRLYAGDGTRVLVVDTATEQVTATVGLTGIGDDGSGSVAVSPDGSTLYATGFSGFVGSLSAVDTATDTVTTTLDLPADNEFDTAVGVALTPDGSQAYLTNGAPGTVSVINTATDTLSGTIDVGRDPSGVVIGP
ncbi:YncE family protein [Streptacidiphilus sp. 4-A2]|nr:YncE family protein [Streptacidiphilus sp. 4-A2]